MADTVKENSASVMQIAAAELKRDAALKIEKVESRKNIVLTVISIALIAAAVLISLFFLFKKNTVEIKVTEETIEKNSLIMAETEKRYPLVKNSPPSLKDVVSYFVREEQVGLNTASVLIPVHRTETGTTTTDALYTSLDFFEEASPGAPNSLTRSLNPAFTIGVYNLNTRSPFLIFTSPSFENTFAGMLTWEPRLGKDLYLFFGTTTGAIQKPYEDMTVKNVDFRALKDDSGKTLILYGFPDKKTLIITENEESFFAIVERLKKQK